MAFLPLTTHYSCTAHFDGQTVLARYSRALSLPTHVWARAT